jgi:Sec-independent protein translocase protein TatA
MPTLSLFQVILLILIFVLLFGDVKKLVDGIKSAFINFRNKT